MRSTIFLFLFINFYLYSQESNIDFGMTEKLGNTIPLESEFINYDGNIINLKNAITKPTILILIYYNCPSICNPLLAEVASTTNKLDFTLGKEYQIISLSFDHRENYLLAQEKRPNYLAILNKQISKNDWYFLTGDSINIKKLTDAVGFKFKIFNNEYAHPSTIIFLSKEGKITRYLYGMNFLPFDMKMGLIEASEGRIGPTISSKFLEFCYNYNPLEKNYSFNITKIIGVGFILLIMIFLIYLLRIRTLRKRSMKI